MIKKLFRKPACPTCNLPLRALKKGEDGKEYYSKIEVRFCPTCGRRLEDDKK